MRLLVECGYMKLLFSQGAPIAEIIAAFDRCKVVEQVSASWDGPKRYEIKEDAEIGITLINDDAATLPERAADDRTFEKFAKLSNERDAAVAKARELEKRLKEIESAVAAKEVRT